MAIKEWFRDLFRREARHYLQVDLPKQRVRPAGGEPDDGALAAEEHYLRLWLVEMYLENDRDWFTAWHPAVHSAVHLEFGDRERSITRVSGPSQLKDVDGGHLDRVVQQNHPLTTLLPFKGGTVGLDAGLLAMEGKSELKTFIKVLGDFSKLLAVPQLSAALDVAGPLADGVAELMGATDGKLELGVNRTFTGAGDGAHAVLRAGYFAVVRATEGDLDRDRFWVVEDQLRYGADADAAQPLAGFPYLLFRVERRHERDDWSSLSAIQEPFQKAVEMIQNDQPDQAEGYVKAAIAAARTADELTRVDRKRVIQALKERYKEVKEEFQLGAFAAVDATLGTAMSLAPSWQETRIAPSLADAEIFAGLE
jgi:hypothetical protein